MQCLFCGALACPTGVLLKRVAEDDKAYFRVTGERTPTRRVTDPDRFDALLSFGVAIVAGVVVTRYRSGRVAKVLTTAEGETLTVFEAWSGVSHRGQH